ncbi:nucleoside/nucleotide kinase family protein [Salinifilum ghardaiensis]
MRVRSVSRQDLLTELADRIDAAGGTRLRVAVDGARGLGTGELADELVAPLRTRGREAVRVRMRDYLRPASLRLEFGQQDPESYYSGWFDLAGLRREALDPATERGRGTVLPALWNAERDRSPRAARVPLPPRGVLLVDGPLLLGAGLPFEFAVHLGVPEAALPKRVPDEEQWTLPALHRYGQEVAPESRADVAVRMDRSERPAIIDAL